LGFEGGGVDILTQNKTKQNKTKQTKSTVTTKYKVFIYCTVLYPTSLPISPTSHPLPPLIPHKTHTNPPQVQHTNTNTNTTTPKKIKKIHTRGTFAIGEGGGGDGEKWWMGGWGGGMDMVDYDRYGNE